VTREWLYWYDELSTRLPTPEERSSKPEHLTQQLSNAPDKLEQRPKAGEQLRWSLSGADPDFWL